MDGVLEVQVDLIADAAYVQLSREEVAETCQLSDAILVDLDADRVVVGIEVLTIDAELPFTELATRFHVRSEVIDFLRLIRPSVGGFIKTQVTSGNDGAAQPGRVPATVGHSA